MTTGYSRGAYTARGLAGLLGLCGVPDPKRCAAAGLDAVIQFDLSGEGTHDAPTMTVSMGAADYVELTSGQLDGMVAFMSGRLRIAGDMGLAMRIQNLFRMG